MAPSWPTGTAPDREGVWLPVPSFEPLWTWVLLVINGLVWLGMTAMGGSEQPLVLIRFGAKYGPLIAAGEYWRLLTACFVHIGLLHLVFNSYALYSFGLAVERRLGRSRFLALYLLAGVTGSALSYLGSDTLSAGASGAIFGLIGAAIAYWVIHREQFGQRGRRQLTGMLMVAGYNLVWGLMMPGIDNLGHIGGLAAGLVLGWAYCPRYQLAVTDPSGRSLQLIGAFRCARAWAASLAVVAIILALAFGGTFLRR